MNNLKPVLVAAMLLLAPAAAIADEFDITMDVVGAEESFDEIIVNRIALPFNKSASDRFDVVPDGAGGEDLIDGMDEVMDEPLPSSGLGTGFTIEQLGETRVLPETPLD